MKNTYRDYLKKNVIFTLLLVFTSIIISYLFAIIPRFIPFLIIIFFGINSITHFFLLKYSNKKGPGFTNFYMISTLIKIFAFFSALIIATLLNKDNRVGTIISIAVIYFLFTFFEIYSILYSIKKNN